MTERTVTDTECKLLDDFDTLNAKGKDLLLTLMETLKCNPDCLQTVEIMKTGNVIQLVRQ